MAVRPGAVRPWLRVDAWKRLYCDWINPIPVLRHQAEKIVAEDDDLVSTSVGHDLLQEAAALATVPAAHVRLVRPVHFVYDEIKEVPVLYNAGPRDELGPHWCESMPDLLKKLRTEKKNVSWQVCDNSMLGALGLLGSISHFEPATTVVGNKEQSRFFVIVDLKKKKEICELRKFLPTDRLATGLGLCTIPRKALKLGTFETSESPEGLILKCNEDKFMLQSIERIVRQRELSLDDWLNLKTEAARTIVKYCVIVDLSKLGASSNLGLFWPSRDFKLLSLAPRLLSDLGINMDGWTVEWGPFQAPGVRELQVVRHPGLLQPTERFVEPRWLSSREIIAHPPGKAPAIRRRTLGIQRPLMKPGSRPRPQHWYRLLQRKSPDMRDTDGGHGEHELVPLHLAMRKKHRDKKFRRPRK